MKIDPYRRQQKASAACTMADPQGREEWNREKGEVCDENSKERDRPCAGKDRGMEDIEERQGEVDFTPLL